MRPAEACGQFRRLTLATPDDDPRWKIFDEVMSRMQQMRAKGVRQSQLAAVCGVSVYLLGRWLKLWAIRNGVAGCEARDCSNPDTSEGLCSVHYFRRWRRDPRWDRPVNSWHLVDADGIELAVGARVKQLDLYDCAAGAVTVNANRSGVVEAVGRTWITVYFDGPSAFPDSAPHTRKIRADWVYLVDKDEASERALQ